MLSRRSNARAQTLLIAVPIALGLGSLVTGALGQQPPPPDLDALAREAEDFTRGRRIGAAVIWGGLIVASILIGWVRMRARRRA